MSGVILAINMGEKRGMIHIAGPCVVLRRPCFGLSRHSCAQHREQPLDIGVGGP
jgi:hypothetical protein